MDTIPEKYKVKKDPIIVNLKFFELGGKSFVLTDDLLVVIATENGLKVEKNEGKEFVVDEKGIKIEVVTEIAEFLRPNWGMSFKVESMSTTREGVINQVLLQYNRLRYFLKKCSFAPLKFENDGEHDYVSNIEELIGEGGLQPRILNLVLGKFISEV